MIPTFAPLSVAMGYLERLDGILLPGSPTDIDPAIFGEAPHPKLGRMLPERDALDFALLKYSEEERLPVLGICFGAQSLNVYRGGKLIQDIPSQLEGANPHGEGVMHELAVTPGSILHELAGASPVVVNSWHHQGLTPEGLLAPGLDVAFCLAGGGAGNGGIMDFLGHGRPL